MSKTSREFSKKHSASSRQLVESIKEQHPQSEFISFENAGHCWDCKQLDGFHNRREGHTYRYNAEVHKESGNAVLKFIEKFE